MADIDDLALCMYKEARSLGSQGMLSVGCVCRNRVGTPGFASTLHNVIYSRNQFTSMSVPSDPEFNLVPDPSDPNYVLALSLASGILDGSTPSNVGNAHYYEVEGTSNPWFDRVIKGDPINHPFVCQVGTQLFFI